MTDKINRASVDDLIKLNDWMKVQGKEYLQFTPDEQLGVDAAAECKRDRPYAVQTIVLIRKRLGIEKETGGSKITMRDIERERAMIGMVSKIANELGMTERAEYIAFAKAFAKELA